MRVDHDGKHFILKARWSEITSRCGQLVDDDFRTGYLHLADVCMLNKDMIGFGLIENAVGMPTEAKVPPEIAASLGRLLTEAMAVGKEITLLKLSRVLDPHGEFFNGGIDFMSAGEGTPATREASPYVAGLRAARDAIEFGPERGSDGDWEDGCAAALGVIHDLIEDALERIPVPCDTRDKR